jgi:uroporphyrin-III C-methyltransferase/precorrin-2 dehydrogenase/sirohydrochlorin ferrochelatase
VRRTGAGRTALLLAAHGSRRDDAALALARRHADALRALGRWDEVAVGFHHGEPGFAAALGALASSDVTVVPFFTSAGWFADEVLPRALAAARRYEDVRLALTPPLGAHPGVPALVARRAATLLRRHRLRASETTIVVVGHGTRRHAGSRGTALALAAALERRRAAGEVIAAFLDDEPGLDTVRERARGRHLLVLPFLVGGAPHARRDVPFALGLDDDGGATSDGGGAGPAARGDRAHSDAARPLRVRGESADSPLVRRHGGRAVVVDVPFGSYPEVPELIADLARPRGVRAVGRARVAGEVHLVGAGPGDPELITVKGMALLRGADVVVHDRLVEPALLREARPDAELVDVGKTPGGASYAQEAINALLVGRARAGQRVVRLKGGDPFVFGRGHEEFLACRAAGVRCTVVPGVTSAVAAPAAVGVPVTARGVARSFAVVTAHRAGEDAIGPAELAAFAAVDTLVVLMGRAGLAALARALVGAGRKAQTPVACIASATTPRQRVVRATLGTIAEAADAAGIEAPMVTVIGDVAAWAEAEATSLGALGGAAEPSGRTAAREPAGVPARARAGDFPFADAGGGPGAVREAI